MLYQPGLVKRYVQGVADVCVCLVMTFIFEHIIIVVVFSGASWEDDAEA